MKKETWLPGVIALAIEVVMVLGALYAHGMRNVVLHSLGIVTSTMGLLFIGYALHFIVQQDFIDGGCRPYPMSLRGSALMLLWFMLLFSSMANILISLAELFELFVSGSMPTTWWWTMLFGYLFYYVCLLCSSHLRAKEDEVLHVDGKTLAPGESFFLWPWLIEEYEACRKVEGGRSE